MWAMSHLCLISSEMVSSQSTNLLLYFISNCLFCFYSFPSSFIDSLFLFHYFLFLSARPSSSPTPFPSRPSTSCPPPAIILLRLALLPSLLRKSCTSFGLPWPQQTPIGKAQLRWRQTRPEAASNDAVSLYPPRAQASGSPTLARPVLSLLARTSLGPKQAPTSSIYNQRAQTMPQPRKAKQ